MALTIKNDGSRSGGGFALLEGPGLSDVTAISIENCFSGLFLGEDGRWIKAPFDFPVESTPTDALSLGPHVVDHVPTELQVSLRSQAGVELGKVFWVDIIPSRNPGSVTSAQVFEQRQRRAIEAKAADDAARQKKIDDAADAAAAAAEAEVERQRIEAARPPPPPPPRPLLLPPPPSRPVPPAPVRRSRRGLWIVLVLLLGIVAWAAFAFNAGLLNLSKNRPPPAPIAAPEPTPEPPAPTPPKPAPAPIPAPAPAPAPAPPKPAPVDCTGTFGPRLDGLQQLSDADKVALGEDALHAGCGGEAFRAFDASDFRNNEAAAWNLARFYDPNESDPVYRRSASVHADYAAFYYRQWRGRSQRATAALTKLCQTQNDGGASLQRSCAR